MTYTRPQKSLSAYRTADTLGSSPIELILKVYDGAISELESVSKSYQSQDAESGYRHLQKCRKFVTHLYTTLDLNAGGEVAQNLGRLYAFILGQLDVIAATKELALIVDNISILDNLRSGWRAVKAKEHEMSAVSNTAKPDRTHTALSTIG
jgi:flagellar protein FliS